MKSTNSSRPSRLSFLIRTSLPALLVLGYTVVAQATTAIIPGDDDMIISSRAIIRAKVISQVCGFDSRHNIVYTYVTVRVREVLKGEINTAEVVLKQPGGQIGDGVTVFFWTQRCTTGEK